VWVTVGVSASKVMYMSKVEVADLEEEAGKDLLVFAERETDAALCVETAVKDARTMLVK